MIGKKINDHSLMNIYAPSYLLDEFPLALNHIGAILISEDQF